MQQFILASLLVLGSLTASADPAQKLTAAKAEYAQRDFTAAGVDHAKQALIIAEDAAQEAVSQKQVSVWVEAKILASQAVYFQGDATDPSDSQTQISLFEKGMNLAHVVVGYYGISDVTQVDAQLIQSLKGRPRAELLLLGRALYYRGANLGRWGKANGVLKSLNKWPELKANMELINNLGLQATAEYGSYRILGYGYFQVPGMFGGDNKKAEQYLAAAIKATPLTGTQISTHPHNTLYYAELIHDTGREDEAKQLLQVLLAQDAAKLNPICGIPEYRDAQKAAQELLSKW